MIHPTQRCAVEVQRPGKPHRHNRVQRKNDTIRNKKAPLHTKLVKNHISERFLDKSLKEILKLLTHLHVLSGTHLNYFYFYFNFY
jgi:hypothetical protein